MCVYVSPQSAHDCSRLTGQGAYTVEVFKPLLNIYHQRRRFTPAATTPPGLAWMSKYVYRYHRLMLLNLAPREPATLGWPLYLYPPPHLLVGYQFLVRTCNDYVFDSRAYSRLRYSDVRGSAYYGLRWTVLANCAYTVNTGTYHRFVDLDDFGDTLQRVQQAVLADRVVADLASLRPLQGFGLTRMDDERDVPVERLLQDYYKSLAVCQSDAWGMGERLRCRTVAGRDLALLQAIRKLKTAYFNYLTRGADRVVSLPWSVDWLSHFVERFSDPTLCDFAAIHARPTRQTLQAVIAALSLPDALPTPLEGGALELRPREHGRAVTERMRRARGEVVRRFIDSLPLPRRRRRRSRAQQEPPPPPPAEDDAEDDAEAEDAEGEDDDDDDGGERGPPPSMAEEVRAAVAEAVRLLNEELTNAARAEGFFDFALLFYQAIQRLEELDLVNEATLRRWVMYFFVAEHAATTLNYLHHNLQLFPPAARRLDIDFAQVVMRARDDDGAVVYNRLWSESGHTAFRALMRRIAADLSATIERAGARLDENELENLLADMSFQEHSGNVGDVLRQVEVDDVDIDSVELSFRFRVTGPVAFSQNAEIQRINARVVAAASAMRRRNQPLPELNARVPLPRDPEGPQ